MKRIVGPVLFVFLLLSDFINNEKILNFDSTTFNQSTADSGFTVLIYWATFQGVLNKPINKKTAKNVLEISNAKPGKIKAYYVNFDMRNSWY